jgi:drug/metabolite transporter (DMT)-like permease
MIALYFEKDHLTLVKTGAALLIFAGVYLVSTQKTNAISNSQ